MPTEMTETEISDHERALRGSTDRDKVCASALALISTEEPAHYDTLAELLCRQEFLERLDDISSPQMRTSNLFVVFRALAQTPLPSTATLCRKVYDAPDFRALPLRLLPALHTLSGGTTGEPPVGRGLS